MHGLLAAHGGAQCNATIGYCFTHAEIQESMWSWFLAGSIDRVPTLSEKNVVTMQSFCIK